MNAALQKGADYTEPTQMREEMLCQMRELVRVTEKREEGKKGNVV